MLNFVVYIIYKSRIRNCCGGLVCKLGFNLKTATLKFTL